VLHPTTSTALGQWLVDNIILRTAHHPELTKPNRIILQIMGGRAMGEVDMGMDPVDHIKEAGGDPLKGPRALTPTYNNM
jgi:hypothetical protein